MDALVGLGDHGAHAEQRGALGGPVAGRAGAVLLAGQDHQRHALGLVGRRRVVDAHLLAIGQVAGHAALGAGRELVAQPDVGEGAADHHLVVAAAGAVAVEVLRRDAVLLQVAAGGESPLMEPAGEMWSVVTESPSTASTRAPVMSVSGLGSRGHAVEVGGLADVGRLGSQANASPAGTGIACQRSSPAKTSL